MLIACSLAEPDTLAAVTEDDRTRRWQRLSRPDTAVPGGDPLHLLRQAIAEVRSTPEDPEARRRLRAIAAEHELWEPLALLLGDEVRAAANRSLVAVALYEELADVHDNLDQPLETIAAMERVIEIEPDDVEHHDRLAWLYRRAGAWPKAAQAFERVAELATDDRSRAALRAAGKLYRDHGKLDRAAAIYREIVAKRPSDLDAWRALDELYAQLGRWRELADVRGERAARVTSGVEKAALLRSQARALEQAGDLAGAAHLVASASQHAPEDVSGLVDYADVLARSGQGREAADILRTRIRDAVERGAPGEDLAALRLRLAGILEEACGDKGAAAAVLEQLLADAPADLPALEWLTAHAAVDPDPRVHAAALLRYAEALPAHDRPAIIAAAARRSVQARDHAGAVRAFEQAALLAPGDAALREELEEARTALVIDRASGEAGTGNVAAAEQRLRAVIAERPGQLEAHLALADVLARTRRLDAAAEHLRDALADAPEDTPGTRLAPLVHRFALVMAALGDADESHQLLHEAHRLDRMSLPITLALGESCFTRRLWRQAALHLGSLADHPDAARHPALVANGLVRAAQAEGRALRPANAQAHYDRAIEIDPGCAAAWHALAEAAIERGELVRGAECLEHEAMATTEPKDRLRLFDALGDMALDVLGEPARAERCWRQVIDLRHASLLDKLLTLQRKRGAGSERGETCERLAELATDPRVIKDLTEEAAQAYVTGGDLTRARAAADRLLVRNSSDVNAVACATAVYARIGDAARVANVLRRALVMWETSGDRGHGDPRRADLWRRLGDAERAIGKEPDALAAYRRAVAIAPESDGALAARRGLVEIASSTGRASHSSLFALVEAEQAPTDVLAWARELARSKRPEDARAAYELARAVGGVLDASDEEFLAAFPARTMASDEGYLAPLDAGDRDELIDDDDDAPLGDLLELLAEAAPLVVPRPDAALVEADLLDAKRIPATSEAAAVAVYPQIAKLLGGSPSLLFATARPSVRDVTLLLASPPVIVLGTRLTAIRAGSRSDLQLAPGGDARLRFELGRIVELSRPRRIFAGGNTPASFARLIAGLVHAFGGSAAAVDHEIRAEGERLRTALPVALRRRITEKLATITRDALDPRIYLAACKRAADRAGLLACGDIAVAIELAGGADAARHLVLLASSQRYLATRKKLRR